MVVCDKADPSCPKNTTKFTCGDPTVRGLRGPHAVRIADTRSARARSARARVVGLVVGKVLLTYHAG